MISLQNVSKTYGRQTIFDGIGFSLNPGERVGLVGRNGHGKTTLFRILTGEESADQGTILIPKNYRIGYLKQETIFTEPSILQEVCLPHEDGHPEEWEVKKILMGLGFLTSDFDRPPSQFSGGYQIRLNLAKVLISKPNLLLLDEPTNFLDIISIRWMTHFLSNWKNEMIIISHDRTFMDQIITHTIGLHRAKLKKIKGITENYYFQIEKEEEVHNKQRLNEEKKTKQIEEFINHFRAKARQANMVQSRIKTLAKQEKRHKMTPITKLSFSFNPAPFPAKTIIQAEGLTFSYNKKTPFLFENLDLTINNTDKVGIVGKNGKGKTTLLKLLAGKLDPTHGKISQHSKTEPAYFEQSHKLDLNKHLNIEEELTTAHPTGDRSRVKSICGAMMFGGDDSLKKINVLSGGEKCRVLLGKLLLKPANILLLDEPTHHLDIESCEAMIEAVSSFKGAALVVTHNEEFLYKIASNLIVFYEDRVFFYPGNYEDFLTKYSWDEEKNLKPKSLKNKDQKKVTLSKKESRKARADLNLRRSKVLKPLQEKIAALEAAIEKAEEKHNQATQTMIKASEHQDTAKISTLSKSLQKIHTQGDDLYNQLSEVTEQYEKFKKQFAEEEKKLYSPPK
ncbi:ATP-binding cassette domain-containing protein, partial [Candidatus Auribacterota bacterium]